MTPPSARDDRRTPRWRFDDRPHVPGWSTFVADDRAASTALGYVLSLTITSILISGLMISAGGFVESEREQVVRSELEVVGQTLIADLEGADRLNNAIDGELTVRSSLPRRVGSSAYTIEVNHGAFVGDTVYLISLSAAAVDVSVRFRLVTTSQLTTGTVVGGELVIEYDSVTDTLVVTET